MKNNIRRMTSTARSEWAGNDWDQHYIANCIGSQRLIHCLQEPAQTFRWSIGDAQDDAGPRTTITARQIGNRTGVPQGAKSYRYQVTGAGFTVTVRAVWHDGKLVEPRATYCKVVKVEPDTEAARLDYNVWLRSLAIL